VHLGKKINAPINNGYVAKSVIHSANENVGLEMQYGKKINAPLTNGK